MAVVADLIEIGDVSKIIEFHVDLISSLIFKSEEHEVLGTHLTIVLSVVTFDIKVVHTFQLVSYRILHRVSITTICLPH